MNKITYALALGAALALCLASPKNVGASPISTPGSVQTLTPTPMSASMFNSLYTPSTTVLTQPYEFLNTPNAGVVESQVFTGTGAAAGTYAYAYQFGVNTATNVATELPTSVNSASMLFNATPVGTNFTGTGTTYAYVVTNGQVGGINVPTAAPGNVIQTPASIAWLPTSSTGSLTFQYLNPSTNSGPLAAGAMSGTVVVISTQPFTQQYVSIQNPEPQTGSYPLAYSPTTGTISPVPAPEPATVLGWAGVIAAIAVGRRFRRRQLAA